MITYIFGICVAKIRGAFHSDGCKHWTAGHQQLGRVRHHAGGGLPQVSTHALWASTHALIVAWASAAGACPSSLRSGRGSPLCVDVDTILQVYTSVVQAKYKLESKVWVAKQNMSCKVAKQRLWVAKQSMSCKAKYELHTVFTTARCNCGHYY